MAADPSSSRPLEQGNGAAEPAQTAQQPAGPWRQKKDIPKLFYNPKGVAAQVLAAAGPGAALFSAFSPPPWLSSPHAQSAMAMARVLAARRLGDYAERQLLMTADGGTLALDWWAPRAPEPTRRRLPSLPAGGGAVGGGGSGGASGGASANAHAPANAGASSSSSPLRRQWLSDSAPVALLIHGINGGSHEGYVRSACAELAARGVRPAVLNLRGCGGQELTSGRGYTALQAPDVAVAVASLSARFPRAPLLGVGFSLGAVLLAKYVAEADMGLMPSSPAEGGGGGAGGGGAGGAGGGGGVGANGVGGGPSVPRLARPPAASGSGFVAVALVSSPVCLHCINARMASPMTHPVPFVYNLLVAAKLRGYWRRHEAAFASSGLIPPEPPPPEPRAPAPPNPFRATPSLVAVSAAKAAQQASGRGRVGQASGGGGGGGGNGHGGGGGNGDGARGAARGGNGNGNNSGNGGGGGGDGGSSGARPSTLAGGGGRAAGGGGGWLGGGGTGGAPLAVLARERARPVNAAAFPAPPSSYSSASAAAASSSRGPRLPPRRWEAEDEGPMGELACASAAAEAAAEAAAPASPAPAAPPSPPHAAPKHLRNVGLTTAGFDGELMRQLGFADRAGYYRHACSTNYLPHVRTPALMLVARDDPFLGTVPARLCSASPWTVLALTRRGGHIGWAHGLAGQRCWSDAAAADWLLAALALWRRQPAGSGWVECAGAAAAASGGGGGSLGGGGGGGSGDSDRGAATDRFDARALGPALRAPRTPREREAASRALADAECTCLAQQQLRRRQREAAAAQLRAGGAAAARSRL